MAVTILSRTISSVGDKRIVVSNGTFVRPIPFGTSWTQLRFGIRFHIRDSGATLTGTPRFVMGVCSGSSNIYGDSSTTNFAGIRTNSGTWTRSATNYEVTVNMFAPTKKVATTITDGTVLNTSWRLPNGAAVPSADRGVFFVDVNKGSPNYTFDIFKLSSGAALVDISRTTFLEQMEVAAPSITNYATGTTAGLALDESAGSFDHLSLFWDRTTPEFEICDIAVSRLA
jgi:hypothetical protein